MDLKKNHCVQMLIEFSLAQVGVQWPTVSNKAVYFLFRVATIIYERFLLQKVSYYTEFAFSQNNHH
jgi:hypothetical protein